ncbi:hypothetical protein GCM10011591_43680 [Nocardia camponoti]|uniref:Uncharacterized protein n=1 Tax=Nocardia camponoti TaxID=1616106 RepID=A0A917QTF8_9NOCA|nr:hypothetical protein GCM10011591_43680 [Nocardia camponoti]
MVVRATVFPGAATVVCGFTAAVAPSLDPIAAPITDKTMPSVHRPPTAASAITIGFDVGFLTGGGGGSCGENNVKRCNGS